MIHRCRSVRSGPPRSVRTRFIAWIVAVLAILGTCPGLPADDLTPRTKGTSSRSAAAPVQRSAPGSANSGTATVRPNSPAQVEGAGDSTADRLRHDAERTIQTVLLFGLVSLAPIALLMVTAFVRINIVLILLRQALGSPQVPGTQILSALALLLTALVMWPIGEEVYHEAISPCVEKKIPLGKAWDAGSRPIKAFMVKQLVWTKHEGYVEALYDYAVPPSAARVGAVPGRLEDFPLRVVAPAFLLSELTTALMMGFYLYLPFLVVDLVVSSVLAATGLFMLPPTLVATPVKLILFVLADGWMLVATMLLSSFGMAGGSH
jgi:flagellar biosynthesis protein FliP